MPSVPHPDIPDTIHNRIPARKVADVPPDVKSWLEKGLIETKNLTEWLAVDRLNLLKEFASESKTLLEEINWSQLEEARQKLAALKMSKVIAQELIQIIDVSSEEWKAMSLHTSDVVREWAALTLGLCQMPFQKKLAWIKPLADSTNSGLREIAWIALRNDVIRDPIEAVKRLVPWTGSRSPNLRRYASEITRPRGVWASHVEQLKVQPEIAIEILESLKADDQKYVKDSVANWLNDASKSRPDWVMEITTRWLAESDDEHTRYIVKRGRRTLAKA